MTPFEARYLRHLLKTWVYFYVQTDFFLYLAQIFAVPGFEQFLVLCKQQKMDVLKYEWMIYSLWQTVLELQRSLTAGVNAEKRVPLQTVNGSSVKIRYQGRNGLRLV